MPTMPYSDPQTLSSSTQDLLSKLPAYNIFRMLSRCEDVFKGFIMFNNAVLNKSALDPRLREVAIIRVGYRTGAEYEVHHHIRIGETLGMARAQMEIVASDRDLAELPEEWALVARVADDLVSGPVPSQTNMEKLRRRFSDREILDLIFAIGCYMMVARLLMTAGVEIEPEGTNEPLKIHGQSAK